MDLDPSEYQAQIRLLRKPGDLYGIKPSEWSKPAVFTIKPGSALISDVHLWSYPILMLIYKHFIWEKFE